MQCKTQSESQLGFIPFHLSFQIGYFGHSAFVPAVWPPIHPYTQTALAAVFRGVFINDYLSAEVIIPSQEADYAVKILLCRKILWCAYAGQTKGFTPRFTYVVADFPECGWIPYTVFLTQSITSRFEENSYVGSSESIIYPSITRQNLLQYVENHDIFFHYVRLPPSMSNVADNEIPAGSAETSVARVARVRFVLFLETGLFGLVF